MRARVALEGLKTILPFGVARRACSSDILEDKR
jgi:hypothetical protein